MYEPEEPTVLNEELHQDKYDQKLVFNFILGFLFCRRRRIPCSADWVITIVEPIENLKKLYQEKIDGRNKGNQSPVIV